MMSPNHNLENRNYTTRALIDRKQRLIAELLTRFKNLTTLACSPMEKGASKEVTAAQTFQMEVESLALLTEFLFGGELSQVRATEDLHRLVRELKEMWLFGPLDRNSDGEQEKEEEGTIDEDSVKVEELLNNLVPKLKHLQFNSSLTIDGEK